MINQKSNSIKNEKQKEHLDSPKKENIQSIPQSSQEQQETEIVFQIELGCGTQANAIENIDTWIFTRLTSLHITNFDTIGLCYEGWNRKNKEKQCGTAFHFIIHSEKDFFVKYELQR